MTNILMPILAAPARSQLLLLLLVFAAAGIIMALGARRQARVAKNSPRDHAREQINRLHDRSEARDIIDRSLVRLMDLSREINGQIDTKFHKLEAVIRDADQASRGLERLIRQARGINEIDITLSDMDSPTEAENEAA